jgi:hypothetical protein
MPKNYEDEIRDLLKGMDRFPGEGPSGPARPAGAPARPTPIRRAGPSGWRPSFGGFQTNAHRVMGGALILILFAWIMQGPWSHGFPLIMRWAGYISLAGTILFIAGLVMMLRSGAFGAGMRQPQRWRGEVIHLSNRRPFWTRWWQGVTRLVSRLGRGSRPGGPGRSGRRGRDSLQW